MIRERLYELGMYEGDCSEMSECKIDHWTVIYGQPDEEYERFVMRNDCEERLVADSCYWVDYNFCCCECNCDDDWDDDWMYNDYDMDYDWDYDYDNDWDYDYDNDWDYDYDNDMDEWDEDYWCDDD